MLSLFNKNLKLTLVSLLTAGALALTGIGVANAQEAKEVTSLAQVDTQSEFMQVLGAIQAGLVTDSNDKPAYDYQKAVRLGVNEHLASQINNLYLEAKVIDKDGMQLQANPIACTGALLGFIALNLSIIGAIKKLGGVAAIVALIIQRRLTWEAFAALFGHLSGVAGFMTVV